MYLLYRFMPWTALLHACLAAVAISYALTRRRGFYSTASWLFLIGAVPVLGPLAFLALANPSVKRPTKRHRAATRRVRRTQGGHLFEGEEGASIAQGAGIQVVELAASLSGLRPTRGNRLEVMTSNAKVFQRIEDEIDAAQYRIWAQYYIVNNDETGRAFLERLVMAAKRGVEVRLLVDAVGSARIDPIRVRALVDAGGHFAIFHPVNPMRRRWAVHLRNHRKIIVIDDRIGITGGMNIGDEYSGRGRRRSRRRPWRDTHVVLRGRAVSDLGEVFAEDWCFATDETLLVSQSAAPEEGGSLVAMIPSGPDQRHNATGLVFFQGIASAARRCYITSPYFLPDDPTLQALQAAALRGVDVRVLVPRKNDSKLVQVAMRSYYPRLLEAGVRVFEYLPRVLHAKTMVVDGAWSILGSANLDIRSFRLNFEASLLVHDSGFASALETQYVSDLSRSAEVTSEVLAKKGWFDAATEGAAQLLIPLL